MEIIDPIVPTFRKTNYLSEAFILLGVALVSIFVFSLLGVFICTLLYDVSLIDIEQIVKLKKESPFTSNILKISQGFSLIGMFAGGIIYLLTTRKKVFEFISFKRNLNALNFLFSIVLVFATLPIVSYLVNLNSEIAKSLGYSSKNLMGVYESLASYNGTSGMILSILIMSLLPAIAEETLFRGVIQTFIKKWSNKKHLAVIVTAFIFAIIHGNPEQVIGIFILGLVLGYLFEFTGNLVYPMILHAANNLVSFFAMDYAKTNQEIEILSSEYTPDIMVVLLSAAVSIAIFVFLYKKSLNNNHE